MVQIGRRPGRRHATLGVVSAGTHGRRVRRARRVDLDATVDNGERWDVAAAMMGIELNLIQYLILARTRHRSTSSVARRIQRARSLGLDTTCSGDCNGRLLPWHA